MIWQTAIKMKKRIKKKKKNLQFIDRNSFSQLQLKDHNFRSSFLLSCFIMNNISIWSNAHKTIEFSLTL